MHNAGEICLQTWLPIRLSPATEQQRHQALYLAALSTAFEQVHDLNLDQGNLGIWLWGAATGASFLWHS